MEKQNFERAKKIEAAITDLKTHLGVVKKRKQEMASYSLPFCLSFNPGNFSDFKLRSEYLVIEPKKQIEMYENSVLNKIAELEAEFDNL